MEIKEGCLYRRGDGKITGALVLTKDQDGAAMQIIAKRFPFYDPKFRCSYTRTGSFTDGQTDLDVDLVCEFSPLPDKITTQDPSMIAWA